MSITNINDRVIDLRNAQKASDLLDQVIELLTVSGFNLEEAERQRYGSINERNKLFTYKVMDYHERQPLLDSPDVEWTGMDVRLPARKVLESLEEKLETVRELSSDQRITYDYYLYQNGLVDYDFAKYKAANSRTGGWQAKVDDLKQFFPNTGGGNDGDTTPPQA